MGGRASFLYYEVIAFKYLVIKTRNPIWGLYSKQKLCNAQNKCLVKNIMKMCKVFADK